MVQLQFCDLSPLREVAMRIFKHRFTNDWEIVKIRKVTFYEYISRIRLRDLIYLENL